MELFNPLDTALLVLALHEDLFVAGTLQRVGTAGHRKSIDRTYRPSNQDTKRSSGEARAR